MTATKTAKRPTAKRAEAPQVGELTWEAVRWAAEIYWPGLGGKAVQQLEEWNRDLFDGAVRPAPVVLTRTSSIHGHWFPLIDSSASQAAGTESELIGMAHSRGYFPPRRVTSISKAHLLRGMMQRFLEQGEQDSRDHNGPAWCTLVVKFHRRLSNKTIWASPEYEKMQAQEVFANDPGLYLPARRVRVQDPCPETGQPSLSRSEIAGWPGSVMDLGHIVKD